MAAGKDMVKVMVMVSDKNGVVKAGSCVVSAGSW
jgi:hypothetical protein